MGASMELNYRSLRSEKARFGKYIDGIVNQLLKVLAIIMIVGGFVLLFTGISIGWFVIGLAAIPAAITEWYEGELRQLRPLKNPKSIDDMLEGDILARLPAKPTPKNIATQVSSVPSGIFYAARFGLTSRLLQDISSDDPQRTVYIWERAESLRQKLGKSDINAGMVIYSLLADFESHELLLAQLNIDLDDIEHGILWQYHLKSLIKSHDKPRRTGGIARDWSFGYIPLLTRFGQNISESLARGGHLNVSLDSRKESVNQLIDTFGSGGRQNAALVGAAGTGKSTVVYAFANKLLDAKSSIPSNLKFRQVFILDAASLIAAAPGRGELENLIMQVLSEAHSAKNIIICLDNAEMFFSEGVGTVDLTSVLVPILEAGNLRMILTLDEQRLLQIGQRNPQLMNALNRINIPPATRDETLSVLQDQLIMLEFKRKVTYTYQSLLESIRLSERYVHDVAQPGRALKLLEASAGYAESGLVTINSVQQAIEKTLDVKVSVASEASDRDKLLNLEQLIHERMINQTRAVQVVSDALRRARAGVRNQDRPIGTFLFLGPTGVGKTELAKALADVYFGGEASMVRLDLNEYVQNEDVSRLIADGANDPSSLTAQVMKQPFSVVLLDEIEKAHPNVLTALLQVLDEGILRDEKNREVSFRDAIVICTSNAGADRIRELVMRGQQPAQFEDQFIDELISSNQFNPEFINRFDEVVTFTPLTKADLLKVVDLMIAGVNKTLSVQKIKVEVASDAKEILVERGYDPRLGARPLRRVIQKAVENVVAKAVLAGQTGAGGTVQISATQVESILGTVEAANEIMKDSAMQ